MYPENEIFREGLDELASHYKDILQLLGEDPSREGLEKTPLRVAKAMQVLTRGYGMDAHEVLTDALFKEDYSQMVIVKDIDFFSLCEHHMLPFYGKVHGCRSPPYVYANAWRGEAEQHHHHQRLQWCLQPSQDPSRVYEPYS